jgi:hypothetical protein
MQFYNLICKNLTLVEKDKRMILTLLPYFRNNQSILE